MRLWCLLAIAVATLVAQSPKPTLKARELFYTPPPEEAPKPPADKPADPPPPPPKATPSKSTTAKKATGSKGAGTAATHAAAPVLGLRYAVLKRAADGQYGEVDPATTFHSGDRIRLRVTASASGYLYVVMQGSTGAWRVLFPSSEISGGNNLVERGVPQQVPSGASGQFRFDENPGTEKLFLVLTRQPELDFDKLIYTMGGSTGVSSAPKTLMASASIDNSRISALRTRVASRDLLFEKSTAANDTAVYVVNTSHAPDARLVADVELKHQ